MQGFKLTRFKLLLLLFIFALAFDILSSGCGIKKPQAPTWMTDWELPLSNRIFTVSELLNDMHSDNIVFDDSGNPFIEFTRSLDTIKVDQSLRFDANNLDIKDSVGIVEIESPPDVNSFTNLSDIVDVGLGFVPPAPFDIEQQLPIISNFTWAHIDQGLLDVTFHNSLEINLDVFTVTLIDNNDQHQIGVLTYQNGLSYLETETQQVDISGQIISNSITMLCHGHTPGGLLLNAGSQRLESTVSFPTIITVSAACAQLPGFTHTKSGNYEIQDSTKVYSSVIYEGNLFLHVINHCEVPFDITLHSQNFKIQGLDFSINRRLEPHEFSEVVIDLAGYNFTPEDNLQTQNVTISMVSTVPSSGSQEYTFRASDSLTVHIDVPPIILESLSGRIKPAPITIDTFTQTLDLPDGLDQTHLTMPNLSLILSNNCMVPAYAEINIDGGGRTLHLTGLVAGKSAPDALPAITTLAPSQAELSQFFDPPPIDLIISGQGIINPNYEKVSLRRNDDVCGDVAFRSALAFEISDTVSIKPQISKVDLNSKPGDLGYGTFFADIENHLPVGVIMTFYLGQASDSTLFNDPRTVILGPYQLSAGLTDSGGIVNQEVNSTISDSLGSDAIALFANDSLFFGERIRLLPTPSAGVVVTGADHIRVGARARLEIKVGGE
ncbi:MAG TPA: hypothetical protein DCZ43_02355 [candidate division Zixibacteria bacterium]|nr:hypothetical protein [candidate division Zixibacteria bacterium]